MTWTAPFRTPASTAAGIHVGRRFRRGEVLRAVIATADARCDGVLPTDVAGVAESFADDLDLVGALLLRWHTRLAARIETEQAGSPDDLTEAVVVAWIATADATPGVRAVLDLARLRPTDEAMDAAMARATAKERLLLGASAGLCGPHDLARGAVVGSRLEQVARSRWEGPFAARRSGGGRSRSKSEALLGRLRSLLPA